MGFLTASRLNKMKNSFREGDYEKAVVYADKLNPSEIRTTYDLSMMSDVYMQTNRLGASKRVLTVMYNRNKSIRVCKQLVELNIKLKNIKQAIKYVKEIHQFDPEDYDRFIYQYQIGKMLNQSDEYLIECLKKVKESDYIDKWALELAKLFYKAGYITECEKECQNIKLWFPDTDYAAKADMLLRACKAGVSYEQTVGSKPTEAELPEEEYFEEEYDTGEIGEEYFGEDISEEGFSEEEFSEDEHLGEEYLEEDYVDDCLDEEASEGEYFEEDEAELDYEEENVIVDEEFSLELSDEIFEEGDEEYCAEGVDELYEFSDENALDDEETEVAVTFIPDETEEIQDEPEYTEDGFEAIDFSAINYEELRRKSDIDLFIAEEEQKESIIEPEDDDEDEVFFDISDSVKSIMENDEPEMEEENFATTLVNDSLTNEVMSALLKHEMSEFGSEDAVDESILKMLDE